MASYKRKQETSLDKYLKNAGDHLTYAPTKANAEKEAEKYRQRLAESQKKADELLKKKQKANEVKATNERSGLIKNIASGNYQKKATPMGMGTGSALTQASALTRIRQNVQDIQAMKTRKNMENLSEATDLQPTQQKPQTTGPVGMSVSQALTGAKKQKTAETQQTATTPFQYTGTVNAPKNPGPSGGAKQYMKYTSDERKAEDNALLMGYNQPDWKDRNAYSGWYYKVRDLGGFDDSENINDWSYGKILSSIAEGEEKQKARIKTYNAEEVDSRERLQELEVIRLRLNNLGNAVQTYTANTGSAPEGYDWYYDFVFGNGAYREIMSWGNAEDKAEAQTTAERIMKTASGEDNFLADIEEEARFFSEGETYGFGNSKELEELRKVKKNRDLIRELSANAAKLNVSGEYDPSIAPKTQRSLSAGVGGYTMETPTGDRTDQAYYYANNKWENQTLQPFLFGSGRQAGDLNWKDSRPEYFMTPEMVEEYNKYYRTDKAAAQAYLDAIWDYLEQQQYKWTAAQQQDIARNGGVLGDIETAGSVIFSPLNAIPGIINTAGAVFGDESASKYYSNNYRMQAWHDNTQAGAVEKSGDIAVKIFGEGARDAGRWVGGQALSIGENVMRMLVMKGLSAGGMASDKAMEVASQFFASGQAAGSTTFQELKNNKQALEAGILGFLDGTNEWIQERIRWGALETKGLEMDSGKAQRALYVLKNIVTEGGEEGAGKIGSYVFETVVSGIFGHENEFQKDLKQLKKDNPGMSDADAITNLLFSRATDVLLEAAGGGIMGGFMAGGGLAIHDAVTRNAGKTIATAEANSKGESGTIQIANTAVGMKEDTESHKLGMAIKAKIDAGKTVSNYELGRLGNVLYRESGGQMVQATAIEIVKNQAQEELKALGMTDPKTTAEAIAKQIVTGEVSKEEHALISGSDEGMRVLASFMKDPEKRDTAIKAGIIKAGSVRNVIENLASGKARSSAAEGLVNRAYRNASIADAATAAMAKGKRTGATDAVRDGQVVQIKGIQFGTKEEKTKVTTEDGKEKDVTSILDDSTVTIQTENGEETVSLDDIQAMDKDTGALLEFIKTNKGIISEQFANTVLNQIAQGKGKQQAGNILDSAMKIRLAAYTDSAMPRTDLDSATAEALWNDSRNEFEAEEKKRTEVRTTIKENQGSLTFEGAEFGTKRWEEKLKRSGLTRAQRDEANTLGEIAKRLGFRVNLINDNENDAIFGWEERNTGTVYINLAGKDENGRSHSILTAAAHEFTHWIEQNSPNEYAKLRSYIIEQLKSQGKDVTAMLMDKVANYELYDQDINLSGAMAEMVADACDSIFSSQEMADKLQEINPTLFGKMKEFISDWIKKVRAVINNMKASRSYESMKLEKQVEEIARIWLGAREEAMNGEATPAAEAQAEETQKSVRQRDTEYMEAVENKDEETERRIVDEAAKAAGYTEKVYHGTPTGGFNTFRDWSYFTKDKAYADRYQNASASSTRGRYEETNKQTYELYMNPGKVFDTRKAAARKIYNEMRMEYGLGDLSNTQSGLPDWTDGRDIIEFIEDKGLDYDTILLDEGADGGYGEEVRPRGISYVTRSNMVKSADPVTYDDNGKVIPPSERFNTTKQDIRYSIRKDSDGRELTKDQQEFFKNSKAVDHAGNLKVLYHGTMDAGFTVFEKTDDIGFFFTDREAVAETYSGTYEQFAPDKDTFPWDEIGDEANYKVYLNLENPLIIDGRGSNWNYVVDHTDKNIVTFDELTDEQIEEFMDQEGFNEPQELARWARNESGMDLAIFDVDNMEIVDGLTTRDWVEQAKDGGYDGVIFENIYDLGPNGRYEISSNVYVAMRPEQIKSVNNTEPTKNPDIRYSVKKTIRNDEGEELAGTTENGATYHYSLRTWTDAEKKRVQEELEKRFDKEKVEKWINDTNGIAYMIAQDKIRLDFTASEIQKFLKPNDDYFYTLDASTLCAKRLLYQGTFNLVQHMLANEVFMPDDLVDLANIMREMGYETPCGICYVESRRRWLDKYASEWLEKYKGKKPRMDQLTTSDGLEEMRQTDPKAYESFMAAMRKKGSANPKVVQLRTDYRGDIGKLTDDEIQAIKNIGGLRIQSFSDFETPHLLDMIQAVFDMASRGLTSQAYTKVPNFAWVFGDTGIKINLSLIGKGTGLDENGNLVFDDIEGMPYQEALKLRRRYSKNVGTILVGINDDHIIAAMGDPTIDFIIPFHQSGWSQGELQRIGVLRHYKDYTATQNERIIMGPKYVTQENMGEKARDNWIKNNAEAHPDYTVTQQENGKYTITYRDGYETESFAKHEERTGEKLGNFTPVGSKYYWDFNKSGEWNARKYLQMCAEAHRTPKFYQFLVDNGDGTFSLPEGKDARSTKIREGYWKTLTDFKMYENDGYGRNGGVVKGAKQEEVSPTINMEQAERVMNEYELRRKMPNGEYVEMKDNNDLPQAKKAAEKFVNFIEYKRSEQAKRAKARLTEAQKLMSEGIEVKPESKDARDKRIIREANEIYDTYAKSAFASYKGNATLGNTESEAEEFYPEKKKVQYIDDRQMSIRSPESHDVERWMAALNADSLESEAEKKLLREFQGLKMQQDLNQLKQTELKNEINRIEALRKAPELTDEEKTMLADLKKRYDKTHHLPAAEFRMMKMLQKKTQSREATAEEKSTLSRLRNLLINAQKKGEAIAEQMYDVTGAEGFASMMYRQHKFIDDEIGDKTREELHETVERMNREAEEIRKELEKTTAELARLEGNAAVQNVKAKLNKAKLHEMAKVVRDQFGTGMSYNELEAAMAEIALKRHAGESIDEDVERLAQRVADTIRYGENETLQALRGLTITIGPGQMAELKGQNSSLNEIRSRLKGTGIKIKQGEYSSLDTDAEDLHRQFTDMPDLGDEKDSLENFVRWVEGLQRNNNAAQQYGLDMDEVRNVVRATSMLITAAEDTQATRNELMDAIRELRTNAEKATARMNAIMKNIEKMIKAGKQAQGLSGVLQSDVAMTINYYNRIAKLAQETAKEKTLRETIIQLKSEAAEAIAKSNEEWRNLIERDRKARETNEKIKTNRNEISRAAKGLYKLWEQPKGLKNVPEELQPLVREAVKLLALNDLADNGMRFLKVDPERLVEIVKKLRRAEIRDGGVTFNYSNMADNNTNPGLFRAEEAIMVLPDLIRQWNTPKKGKNKLDTLEMRLDVAKRINECITDIQNVVRAAQTVNTMQHETTIANMADMVLSDTYTSELDENGKPKSRYFREMTGKVGRALAGLHKAIISGNMTPEYFFRTLGNRGLSELWDGYHEAENRNGLELRKAQERIAQIAEKNGYAGWDTKERHEIKLENGETVKLTTGQLMSLYATWKREKTVNPEMSMHLRDGGFYAEEQDLKEGILGRTEIRKRAHKFSDADAQAVQDALTKEQIQFVDDMVAYMSSDLAALGNEASMAAYGIKLYKEDYYFPMKMWDGVKNKKSNEAGSAAAEIDRAFHQSFTKARKNNANSALMIGDFMETVADHVSGMINFATMGLMNENLQKVLNYKIEEFEPNSPMGEAVTVDEETGEQEGGGGNTVKRNVRAKLEEAYGRTAMDYLNELKKQLNGGAVRTEKSLGDKAISMFRKNAVAGSMSVAFQQPLSYLRAAMLINPKYLIKGVASEYWKGSYEERMANSGVSVIKDMGRFDMNFGQSAREYLMPEGKEGKFRKAWNEITDKATILPELMDRWTWNRMWVAVKAEQHDLHPEMDVKSDEFLKKCSDRFNELMRRTQVYDSVLVKSANMRSQHYFMKNLTSFMAEPTLTANVLMDAVRMAKNGEPGGLAMVRKAGAIFVLSAVFQAAVKAAWSSGRSPDEKKTWLENFLNRFGSSLISEGDPLNLIPGYSELVALFKKGEISDDAMGAMGKIISAGWTGIDMLLGKEKDAWRAAEDSIGQLAQLFTNLPAKNISRDARAIFNWITGGKYAARPTSGDVLKWQTVDNLMNADSLIGALNYRLEEAGWQTSTKAYAKRIYGAKKAGNEKAAESMENYLLLGKGAKESSITSEIRSAIKADNSTTAAQKVDYLRGMTGQKDSDIATWVMNEYKDGNIDRKEAETLYKKANPKKTDDDAYWAFAKADQAMATGETVDTEYFRIYEAMDANKAEDITKAVKELTAHGKKKENVRTTINNHYKELYLKAGSAEKVRIRDAMNKAYKALGYTTADVSKTISNWTKGK